MKCHLDKSIFYKCQDYRCLKTSKVIITMKDLIRLTSLQVNGVYEIFNIADKINAGKYSGFLNGKSVVMFFPASSIRTRVTFEKGIYMLGGHSILFPDNTLDKKKI